MGPEEANERPLLTLVTLLRRARPPRISALAELLEAVAPYQEFVSLVQEFLPDRRQEILEGSPPQMVDAFVAAFQESYFPLADGLESLSDLVSCIPIEVFGWDYDTYHELPDMRPAIVLASLLVAFEMELDGDEEGIRLTALEAAERWVPRELLERVAEAGFPLSLLEARCSHSPDYRGLLYHAQIMCHATDCVFYDLIREDIWSDPPDWSREAVDHLTEQWQEAERIRDEVESFYAWLQYDLEGHFRELVAFLEGTQIPREQLPLPLEFKE